MTTIAFDGQSLAADGRVMSGDMIVTNTATKIFKHGTKLIAGSGSPAHIKQFFDWYKYQQNSNYKDIDINVIVCDILTGIAYFYDSDGFVGPIDDTLALGSGREYAAGAISQGATARQAVEIASKFDPYTGGKIEVYTLENMKAEYLKAKEQASKPLELSSAGKHVLGAEPEKEVEYFKQGLLEASKSLDPRGGE